jgi:ceramide glucosyltransferase
VAEIAAFFIALGAITVAGALYLALAVIRLWRFAQRGIVEVEEFAPSVTILKPLAGEEPQLYENLASFCDQDYPEFEIVFCVHSQSDTALPIARRLTSEFPHARPRIAIGNNDAIANPKIANLAKLGAEANGEIVLVSDGDVRVGRDYLRAVCAEFATERVVAATCLYRGLPNDSLVSRLGAAHIEDEFAPSVLVALALGPLRFCLGATMAIRKPVLDAIGGLAALGPYLADDHALGELASRHGTVALSPYVVATQICETTFTRLWSHELRWARTNRAQAPLGYFFSCVTFALPFALLYLAVARSILAAVLLAAVVALRVLLHAVARRALHINRSSDWWLIPARDFLGAAIWLVSLFGRSVRWRSLTTRITPDGHLEC